MKRVIAALVCLIFMVSIIPVDAASVCGDTDGDGIVTIMDATYIQRFLADLKSDVPVGEREIKDWEPIEYNFIPILENEEVGYGEDYHIYSSDELTDEILTHRAEGNTLIVERVFAEITDSRPDLSDGADGVILGTDYCISYRFMNVPVTEGTIMCTYLIYNPNNNYVDDIVNRYDFVLDRSFERN